MSGFEESPALVEVKEYIDELYALEEQLIDKVDSLPLQGEHINALDEVRCHILIMLYYYVFLRPF